MVTRAFGTCAAALMRGGFLRWEAVKAEVHRPYANEETFWRMAHFRRLGLRLLAPCLSACPAVAAGDESYLLRVWVAAMAEVEQVGGPVPPAPCTAAPTTTGCEATSPAGATPPR